MMIWDILLGNALRNSAFRLDIYVDFICTNHLIRKMYAKEQVMKISECLAWRTLPVFALRTAWYSLLIGSDGPDKYQKTTNNKQAVLLERATIRRPLRLTSKL